VLRRLCSKRDWTEAGFETAGDALTEAKVDAEVEVKAEAGAEADTEVPGVTTDVRVAEAPVELPAFVDEKAVAPAALPELIANDAAAAWLLSKAATKVLWIEGAAAALVALASEPNSNANESGAAVKAPNGRVDEPNRHHWQRQQRLLTQVLPHWCCRFGAAQQPSAQR
jgi:hypothetical protein